MLYPKSPLQNLLTEQPDLSEKIWDSLNAINLDDLLQEGRVYGGGLYKIEPKELRRVALPPELAVLNLVSQERGHRQQLIDFSNSG